MRLNIFGTPISKLFQWLSGGALNAIGGQLNQAYQARLNAQNDTERIDADQRIATLNAQQSVLIAEQGSKMTCWIRPAFALPFVIYNCKIIIWDKVLNQGATDPLSPEFWQLQMIVFGAYFLTRPFEKK